MHGEREWKQLVRELGRAAEQLRTEDKVADRLALDFLLVAPPSSAAQGGMATLASVMYDDERSRVRDCVECGERRAWGSTGSLLRR
jgi:hypothetical protein